MRGIKNQKRRCIGWIQKKSTRSGNRKAKNSGFYFRDSGFFFYRKAKNSGFKRTSDIGRVVRTCEYRKNNASQFLSQALLHTETQFQRKFDIKLHLSIAIKLGMSC